MFVCFALGTLIMLPCLIFTVSLEDFRATANPRIWYGILYTGIVTLALANAFHEGCRPAVEELFNVLTADGLKCLDADWRDARFQT